MLESSKQDKINPEAHISWALIGGHALECFDNTLYGFFAVLLAPLFFPDSSSTGQILASYGAFAAGFIARPLGAILFGSIGDKVGRKIPLLYSLGLVGIPTIGIGLLPSYESIGILAPLLLMTFRLAQGLFMGGEYSGVNIYLIEGSHRQTLGKKTGFLIASGIMGAVLATAFGALATMEIMPKDSWRIPFILGGLFAFVIYFYRKQLAETEAFIKDVVIAKIKPSPWKEVLQKHKRHIVVSCLVAGMMIMPLYLATIFANQLFKEVGYTQSQSMLLNMLAMFLDAIFVLYFGRLADKIGFKKQLIIGSLTSAIIAFPAFMCVLPAYMSTFSIYVFIFLLTTPGCIVTGSAMPYIGQLFPTTCRYTGTAISVTMGHALLGGTTPLMASFLTDCFGTKLAPAFWLILFSCLTAIGVAYTKPFNSLTNEK